MKKFIPIFFLALLIFSCGSSDEGVSNGTTKTATNYDRSALLKNMADNIIIPSYKDFQTQLTALKTSVTTFTGTPNQIHLDEARTNWLAAYKAWQKIEAFNIGKAEELLYGFYMNIYPADVTTIENNITSGSYNLDNINLQAAQGFPALDYLLNGLENSDAAILSKYEGANAAKYKKYLTDVVTRMDNLTTTVASYWENGYRDTFVNNTESSATGSVSKITNDYIYYYEKGFRANKIGIPAGVFSNGTTFPSKVEAYYKKNVSKLLAKEAFEAVKNLYKGGNGYGFETALKALNRADLNTKINENFAIAEAALNELDDNFATQVTTNNTKMLQTYDKIQTVVRLLKVDMTSALSISIDYVDADGD